MPTWFVGIEYNNGRGCRYTIDAITDTDVFIRHATAVYHCCLERADAADDITYA